MYGPMKDELSAKIVALKEEGLYKAEAPLTSPQSGKITVDDGREVINLCANNYLGLADSPVLIEAAKRALDEWGFGMASVRFICGTQTLHQKLERAITEFLHPDDPDNWDTILYSSCFDANGGLLRSFSALTTRLFPTSLTMPRSSMGSGCARPSASVTVTRTWPTLRPNCRLRRAAGTS